MIRCHLAVLMAQKKMKVIDVARETGINRSLITGLYKETTQRIDLNSMELLCKLFDCGVGELFEYQVEYQVEDEVSDT
jgi:putative transcriptional regulator